MIVVIGYIAKFIRVLASQFTELRIVANTSLKEKTTKPRYIGFDYCKITGDKNNFKIIIKKE